MHTGRYGKPTMAFIVLAGHNYQIFYCSQGYPGSMNDIQLVNADKFCQDLTNGTFTPVKQWECKNEDNITIFMGGYCISDSGLPRTALFVDPMNYDWSWAQTIFCEWLESVRKDIECVFGHLKQRFRRLANANQSHDLKEVEYCFKTCCALHNMMLKYTGPIKVTNWEDYDPEQNEELEYNPAADEYTTNEIQNPHDVVVEPRIIGSQTQQDPVVNWYAGRYALQREWLMKHFMNCYQQGNIYWPRNFKNRQKATMEIPAPIMARIEQNSQRRTNTTLYVARSKLYRKDPINGTYSKSIGMGLFTNQRIVNGERIVTFNGEVIDSVQYHLRTAAGRGGYMTYLSENLYLDCYQTCHNNQCLASVANCALHCFDISTNRMAYNNATYRAYKISHSHSWKASLVATRRIEPHDEILWPYGPAYVYPDELSTV